MDGSLYAGSSSPMNSSLPPWMLTDFKGCIDATRLCRGRVWFGFDVLDPDIYSPFVPKRINLGYNVTHPITTNF